MVTTMESAFLAALAAKPARTRIEADLLATASGAHWRCTLLTRDRSVSVTAYGTTRWQAEDRAICAWDIAHPYDLRFHWCRVPLTAEGQREFERDEALAKSLSA